MTDRMGGFMSSGDLPRQWDEAADVVVVGSGFAGLAAAIEAKTAGGTVLILEKMKGYGGNSAISDGVIAACGTRLQREKGIADSARLMAADMQKAGLGLNHPELVEALTKHAGETFDWTIDYLGIHYLERVDQFGGHSVARSHTPTAQSGAVIVKHLLHKVRTLGLTIHTRTLMERILFNHEGRVCGVVIRRGFEYPNSASGRRRTIRVRRALILAGGGYGSDVKLRAAQNPQLGQNVGTTNKYAATGETLKEALRIGAMPVHLCWIQLGPWTTPDEKGYGAGGRFIGYTVLPYGIIVDPDTAERFVNELDDRKQLCDVLLRVGRPCIGIADKKGVAASGWDVRRAVQKGTVKTYDRIKDLAAGFGLDSTRLSCTLKKFNRHLAAGRDTEFAKPILRRARPLQQAPFFGVRIQPKVHYTMGGILINGKAQVLDVDSRPIEGLFAAGEITGGVHGACRLGGCAIIDCLVFGRIAGKTAAAR